MHEHHIDACQRSRLCHDDMIEAKIMGERILLRARHRSSSVPYPLAWWNFTCEHDDAFHLLRLDCGERRKARGECSKSMPIVECFAFSIHTHSPQQ